MIKEPAADDAWQAGQEDAAADTPLTGAEARDIARRAGRPDTAPLTGTQDNGDGEHDAA